MARTRAAGDLAVMNEELRADLRQAARALAKGRSASLAAILVLGVGIGANSAVFSVVDAVLLRGLPLREPERLVMVWDTKPQLSLTRERPSPGNFLDWRERCKAFSGLSLWHPGTATLRGDFDPEVVVTAKVTPDFFRVLGAPAGVGGTFGAGLAGAVYNVAERYRSGDRELVISDALWRRRFGADGAAIGKSLSLDGAEWRIAGVMPARFAMPSEETEVWLPWDVRSSYLPNDGPGPRFLDGPPRDFRFLNVFGRLAPGVTLEEAEKQLQALAAQLAAEHPKYNEGWSVRLAPLREERVARARGPLLAIAGAVACVLLLACFNAAGLLLARAEARTREVALRLALGIQGRRLVRQMLFEGLLLSLLASLLGLALAAAAVRAVVALRPAALPSVAGIALDLRVLAFTVIVAACVGLLAALVPALQALKRDVAETLLTCGRGGHAPLRQPLRRALVAGQVALSLALLAGAGLCLRSLSRLMAVPSGFDADGVLVMKIALQGTQYRGAQTADFYRALLSRLRALPGVTEAGAVTSLPMQDLGFDRPVWREDEKAERRGGLQADVLMATPGYFRTLRIPLLAGRPFDDDDRFGGPRVIAVNQTLARRLWPGADAVGRRLVIDYQAGAYSYEVVAVVGDTRHRGLRGEPRRELFLPHAQNPYLALNVALRTTAPPRDVELLARKELRGLDPAQPMQRAFLLADVVRASTQSERLTLRLFGVLALLALALAATGLYALLSFLVARRRHELGIRIALGATGSRLRSLVLGESLRLLAAGSALGLALAAALSRLLSSQLYGVSPADPAAHLMALLLLGLVVALASLQPAGRAAAVDPVRALRGD
jgi:putative ABC transport system permease protein